MVMLQQFVATENSQALDYDGILADTGQCVQLVSYYCLNVLGITPPSLNAVDWWNDYASTPVLVSNFDRIGYNANSLPLAGDIVVFGASESINSPLYGHIDIAISVGAPSGYTGFDSNWGGDYNAQGYPIAHQVQHNYTDVLGYLRIKESTMEPFNQGDLENFLIATLGSEYWLQASEPANQWFFGEIGKDFKTAIYTIMQSEQFGLALQANQKPANSTVLAPGNYTVQ